MTEIEIIAIVFSFVALLISLFGYLDNRKKLTIVLEKENERKDIRKALETLKLTSDELKSLPKSVIFGQDFFMFSDILQEVYEKDRLDLIIEYKYLEIYHDGRKKYPIDSINAQLLRQVIKEFSNQDTVYGSGVLIYSANPNVIQNEFLDLNEFITGLIRIEKNLNKMKEIESIIDPFDGKLIKTIDMTIEEILELFSDALKKKSYHLEFERNMKPTEIQNKIYVITNYTPILTKVQYLSTEVASSVDGIRSKLFELVLTK